MVSHTSAASVRTSVSMRSAESAHVCSQERVHREKYFVDAQGAGPGKVGCSVQGPMHPHEYDQSGDGTAVVKYLPVDSGEYTVNVSFAGEAIPDSLFHPVFLVCTDGSKVKAYGPGIQAHESG